MPEPIFCDVLILGAGIAGLSAAKILTNEGLNTIVLEARSRNGGRIHTIKLRDHLKTPRKSQSVIDLGASYLHGCDNSQEIQPLFTLASRLKMLTSPAAGDVLGPHRGWECPEVAIWRDNKSGEKISLSEVADMSFLLDRCLLYILMTAKQKKNSPNRKKTLSDALPGALEASLKLLFKSGHRSSSTLSTRERGIFDSLLARYIAYVNPTHRIPVELSLGPHYEADAVAGLALDAEQPCSLSKKLYLNWLEEKCLYLKTHGPRSSVARRIEHKWEDRLVLDGFSKFIDFLSSGVNIHQKHIVRHVYWPSRTGVKASMKKLSENREYISTCSRKRLQNYVESCGCVCAEVMEYIDEKCIPITCQKVLKRYFARFCIITVPVGVLKNLDHRSSINFHPSLPMQKRHAINRLGIPKIGSETHNKVVLAFDPASVFWDKDAAHLACPGARLHILNCDFYGISGILVAHVWGGSKLRITGRPDEEVIKDLMELLGGMYPSRCPLPEPIFTHVTRWSEDPFSLGAYTAGEVGSSDADRHAYASSLPTSDFPRLLFAGEGTVDSTGGQQCTHGAFTSGVERALDILDNINCGRCRLRDIRIIDYLTGRKFDRFPPHEMVRRTMKCKSTEMFKFPKGLDGLTNELHHVNHQSLAETLVFPTEPECSDKQSSGTSVHSLESNNDMKSVQCQPTRRSSRFSTWISTQASSSLFANCKVIMRKKRIKQINSINNNTDSGISSISTGSGNSLNSQLFNEDSVQCSNNSVENFSVFSNNLRNKRYKRTLQSSDLVDQPVRKKKSSTSSVHPTVSSSSSSSSCSSSALNTPLTVTCSTPSIQSNYLNSFGSPPIFSSFIPSIDNIPNNYSPKSNNLNNSLFNFSSIPNINNCENLDQNMIFNLSSNTFKSNIFANTNLNSVHHINNIVPIEPIFGASPFSIYSFCNKFNFSDRSFSFEESIKIDQNSLDSNNQN